MKSILFVDDERDVLDGLRRMLRSHRKEWDMHFCESAEEAMQLLDSKSMDAIVSDMRMPGTDGAKLLNWVREKHPNVIRIALSGYADSELTLESLHATHQFISKPADPGQIEKALERTMRVRETLSDRKLVDALNGLSSLPTLPEVYDELMGILASEDFTMEDVGHTVERDMSLSVNLLKVVNSAFFGLYGHIESPFQAVLMLGSETVKNLALKDKVFNYFDDQNIDADYLNSLNTRAQLLGALAGKFAATAKLDKRSADHAQIAGLMSQIGELVCSSLLKDHNSIASGSLNPNVVGGHILALWGLPDAVVEAVLFYQDPNDISSEKILPVHVLHAAWLLTEKNASEEEIVDDIANKVGSEIAESWLAILHTAEEELNECA